MTSNKNKLATKKSVAIDAFDLQIEIKEVISEHLNILNKTKQAFELAVKLGERLVRIKANLPHGHFKKVLSEKVEIISLRTSQRYMQIFFNQDELRQKLGDALDISRATKYLSDRSKKPKDKIENDIDATLIEETQKTLDEDERKKALSRYKHNEALPTDKVILLEVFKDKKQKKDSAISKLQSSIEKDKMRIKRTELNNQKREERIQKALQDIEKLNLEFEKIEKL